MADAERIARKAQDCIDTLEAIRDRARRAQADIHTPSRNRSELGTRTTGSRSGADVDYDDPVGNTALGIIDTLNRVDVSLTAAREGLYAIAHELADWAPPRPWDNNTPRCGIDGCARPRHAIGLCQSHYRRQKRADEAEAARQQAAR